LLLKKLCYKYNWIWTNGPSSDTYIYIYLKLSNLFAISKDTYG